MRKNNSNEVEVTHPQTLPRKNQHKFSVNLLYIYYVKSNTMFQNEPPVSDDPPYNGKNNN